MIIVWHVAKKMTTRRRDSCSGCRGFWRICCTFLSTKLTFYS